MQKLYCLLGILALHLSAQAYGQLKVDDIRNFPVPVNLPISVAQLGIDWSSEKSVLWNHDLYVITASGLPTTDVILSVWQTEADPAYDPVVFDSKDDYRERHDKMVNEEKLFEPAACGLNDRRYYVCQTQRKTVDGPQVFSLHEHDFKVMLGDNKEPLAIENEGAQFTIDNPEHYYRTPGRGDNESQVRFFRVDRGEEPIVIDREDVVSSPRQQQLVTRPMISTLQKICVQDQVKLMDQLFSFKSMQAYRAAIPGNRFLVHINLVLKNGPRSDDDDPTDLHKVNNRPSTLIGNVITIQLREYEDGKKEDCIKTVPLGVLYDLHEIASYETTYDAFAQMLKSPQFAAVTKIKTPGQILISDSDPNGDLPQADGDPANRTATAQLNAGVDPRDFRGGSRHRRHRDSSHPNTPATLARPSVTLPPAESGAKLSATYLQSTQAGIPPHLQHFTVP